MRAGGENVCKADERQLGDGEKTVRRVSASSAAGRSPLTLAAKYMGMLIHYEEAEFHWTLTSHLKSES